jgi:hypothetical protein
MSCKNVEKGCVMLINPTFTTPERQSTSRSMPPRKLATPSNQRVKSACRGVTAAARYHRVHTIDKVISGNALVLKLHPLYHKTLRVVLAAGFHSRTSWTIGCKRQGSAPPPHTHTHTL